MTTKEAIRILDPETTAEALAEIEYYAGFSGQTAKVQAVNDACEIAVSALRDQQETGWISVEDKLPQETGEVCRVVNLMMDNGLETAGWLNDITGLGYFLDSRSSFIRQAPISRFTHWMPLPEPPEVEV